jgi:hypothetical protein
MPAPPQLEAGGRARKFLQNQHGNSHSGQQNSMNSKSKAQIRRVGASARAHLASAQLREMIDFQQKKPQLKVKQDMALQAPVLTHKHAI